MKIKKIFTRSVALVVVLFSIFMWGLDLLNGAFDLYNHVSDKFNQRKAEDNLNVIYTGTSIKHIESVFGAPMQEDHSDDGKVNEYIYSFKKFYLQIVYDYNNRVILYSVTSKDKNFHPMIPYLGKELGNKFEDYGDSIDYLQSGYSSKFYQYEEGHYIGNPGNYRNFYLSFNPAGVEYFDLDPLPDIYNGEEYPPNEDDLKKFRANNAPNTFSIGEIQGSNDGPELYFGLGINYYEARDIPESEQ
ncbi:TPA: ETEC_3214 domain-containing protein [Providencia rettgeri]|uniref:ETEC_3214 domain-containing protein n=1 Tax=unclassified Providencia TaxID=2633465 RepID=UPI00234B8B4C|nr:MULTISPECIES: ETEC_3214 domain-containing protein [unclassified Providencia]